MDKTIKYTNHNTHTHTHILKIWQTKVINIKNNIFDKISEGVWWWSTSVKLFTEAAYIQNPQKHTHTLTHSLTHSLTHTHTPPAAVLGMGTPSSNTHWERSGVVAGSLLWIRTECVLYCARNKDSGHHNNRTHTHTHTHTTL